MTTIKFKKFNIDTYKPVRSSIRNMRKVVKLSANESALGVSSKVKKIISKKNLSFFRYPDPKSKKLRMEISKKFKCNIEKIICGSGSDEVIQMLCQLFLRENDEVVVPQYSFLMYRIYSKIVGANVKLAKEINFKVSVKEILKKTSKKTKIVFIANPNNPTGTYLTKNELLDLRRRLNKNILLVVDDAYFEYMKNKDYKSGIELFKNSKNVFILRTFSKIYGLASLRIGWGYGDKSIIKELYKIKPPFNVNKFAQICAVESLKDDKFVKKSVIHNLKWCKKIKNEMLKYNIGTNKISGNFFLLDFKKAKFTADTTLKKLQKYGIILREMNSYGIKNCLRLTIGNTKENQIFLKRMNTIFKNV